MTGVYAADYWIGLRERDDPWESVTEWADGSAVVVSNWAAGEPRPGMLGCVAAIGTFDKGRSPGQWYVDECDARKFALCKGPKEGFELASTTPRPNSNGCPSGWMTDTELPRCFKVAMSCENIHLSLIRRKVRSAISITCLQVYAPTSNGSAGTTSPDGSLHRATWDDAEEFCTRYRTGHLASVRHVREQTLIYSALIHN